MAKKYQKLKRKFQLKGSVALIGMRGVGKSTLCHQLTKKWQVPMFSLDDVIVSRQGKTIEEIVQLEGWKSFRSLEREVLQEFATSQTRVLLDCGGGILENENGKPSEEKIDILVENFFIIYITMEKRLIIDRLKSLVQNSQRPSLPGAPSPESLIERRHDAYLDIANVVVDVSHITPLESAERVHQLVHGTILKAV